MNHPKTSDEVMRELNDRAKVQGRYLAASFSEIPRSPGSLLDRPDTAESNERIRKAQEYIARARGAQTAALLTEREHRYCADIKDCIVRVREFLLSTELADSPAPKDLFQFLAMLREIQGNLSNDVSFAATLLAKEYLSAKFDVTFDAAEKPQGAKGIDIDIQSPSGERIVAEIKTTVPYRDSDFGEQQRASFKKDFVKLAAATAMHKFLFVTDSRAYLALQKQKYLEQIPGVHVVNLITAEGFTG
jgi:hypothetical protein